ncbi:hypothetical protein Calab_1483 [Caldithrix abyssi DSM 13497]|uniref:Uncharacterized protein n=1 Tax=Caldithrix abyssi DSM 13497 TaxID=880073 RepID=H1XPX8_CALAY|nr:hypothetical protein [Caldithrix abyssi]APF20367.1 hypothetical protein Cabys_3621 [Caldithrix abyssi DSM 13497]EHO41104.1 hypothetical protein Calab_1483 [Caldithrix abyssi DSM 13497]
MRVSVFNVESKNKTLSYAYVNGAEACSRHWGVALLKTWWRSLFLKERYSFLQRMVIFRKYFIHLN